MSMFRRRRGASLSSTPSASAQTAAAQAFLANRSSNANLSNAAAAAALRSGATTPTNPANIQTKRMVSRQSSVSSNGSRPDLRRQGSSGSMSERTFRDASPSRPSSSSGALYNAPPVPPLPQHVPTHRRASSLEPPPLRVTSPTPSRPGGRGVSLDRGAQPTPAKKKAARRVSNLESVSEVERSNSRNSTNFSYPLGTRNTPPASPSSPTFATASTSSAAKRQVIPTPLNQVEADSVRLAVNDAANKIPKKKKKKVAPGAAEGSHLSSGTTIGGAPTGTAVRATPKTTVPHNDYSEHLSQDSTYDAERSVPAQDEVALKALPKPNGKLVQRREESNGNLKSSALPEINGREVQERSQLRTPSPLLAHDRLAVDTNGSVQRRPSSNSPSRTAHFGAHLLTPEDRKHEPPPRSLSPGKPALKHSSSPHGSDNHSPVNRSILLPGEMSDSSAMSEEVPNPVNKRRKNVRVSFEANPEVMGIPAAEPASHVDEEDAMDDVMTPRPVLPSFGSVRGRKEQSSSSRDASPSTTRGSTANSSLANSWAATMDTSISSDHALGGILVHDFKARGSPLNNNNNDPLAPEVTSVEGTGIDSGSDVASANESESDEGEDEGEHDIQHSTHPLSGEGRHALEVVAEEPESSVEGEDDIPVIAVQPATPATTDVYEHEDWLSIPGGFPVSSESFERQPSPTEDPLPDLTKSATPATKQRETDQAKVSSVEAVAKPNETPQPSSRAIMFDESTLLHRESESEDSGDSIYSDAAEDLSDMEDATFGSINAIVDSPAPPSPPHTRQAFDEFSAPPAKSKKRVQKQQQLDPQNTFAPGPPLEPKTKKTKKKVVPAGAQPAGERATSMMLPTSPLDSAFPRIKGSQPITTPTPGFRQSMRAGGPVEHAEPAFRQSMRGPRQTMRPASPADNNEPAFRSSMRGNAPGKSSLRNKNHTPAQTYVPPPGPAPKGALQKRNIRPNVAAAIPAPAPAAKPMPSVAPMLRRNNSDSSSSFRKERRRPQSSNGRYTMKRSMRGGPSDYDQRPSTAGPGRPQSAMSASLAERRPMTSGGMTSGTMRSSMRGSNDAAPTLRAGKGKTPSLFSNSSRKSEVKTTKPSRKSAFNSRFNDSSDEEGGGPATFNSRFADSSDDEPEPLNLRPVRGIPRARPSGDDSTDLEDSSEDEQPKTTKPKVRLADISEPSTPQTSTIKRQNSGSGRDLGKTVGSPIPSLDEGKKKKGFFGRFKSKRNDSGVRKSSADSAARRDTHLQRSPAELESTRSPASNMYNTFPSPPGTPTSPKSSKLQRRSMPARTPSGQKPPVVDPDAWPLPSPTSPNGGPKLEMNRPSTSDGLGSRPAMHPRIFSNQTDGTAVSSRTGKKKRFPMLRKAFGLHD